MKKVIIAISLLLAMVFSCAVFASAETDISNATIYLDGYSSSLSYSYTGSQITPTVSVKTGSSTIPSTNYQVAYMNNINAGTATVTVTGTGDYSGTCSKTFTIKPVSISYATVSAANVYYSGKAEKPVITATYNNKTLVEGVDYTVDTSTRTSVGSTSVSVNGKGNFSGYKTVSYEIVKKPLSMCTITVSDQVYTGNALKPEVKVYNGSTVVSTSDYTVSYSNNINVGYATVTVTASSSWGSSGNYTGTATKQFAITEYISNADFSFDTVTYDGTPKNPIMYITIHNKRLVNNVDYTYTVSNNVNAGYATVVVTGKGLYKGTVTKSFKISPKSISGIATIELVNPDAEYKYNGEAHRPEVTVYTGYDTTKKDMVPGTEYTISYSKNINPGNAKVIAYGTGNYTGSVSVQFNIKPSRPVISSLVKGKSGKITIKIKKGPSSCKYKIYRNGTLIKTTSAGATSYIDKATKKNGKKYTYTIKAVAGTSPAMTSEASLPKVTYYYKAPTIRAYTSGNRSLSASWSKNSYVDGYQLQRSTRSSFSSKTTYNISGRSNTSRYFSGLSAGTRYYYRVRTYVTKTVDVPVRITYDDEGNRVVETEKRKIKYYSDWSNVSSAVPITSSSHHSTF